MIALLGLAVDIPVALTGILIGGAAYSWRSLLGFFTSLSRKFTDQVRTTEKTEHLRHAAERGAQAGQTCLPAGCLRLPGHSMLSGGRAGGRPRGGSDA